MIGNSKCFSAERSFCTPFGRSKTRTGDDGGVPTVAGDRLARSFFNQVQLHRELAELAFERRELETQPEHELIELAEIYEAHGVSKEVALEVAKQLTANDALGAHAGDELGITDTSTAQPVQAALTSALTFSAGAIVPVLTAIFAPPASMQIAIPMISLIFLAGLGAVSAKAGGAGIVKPTIRVAFWGALAMVTTGLVGALIGKAI